MGGLESTAEIQLLRRMAVAEADGSLQEQRKLEGVNDDERKEGRNQRAESVYECVGLEGLVIGLEGGLESLSSAVTLYPSAIRTIFPAMASTNGLSGQEPSFHHGTSQRPTLALARESAECFDAVTVRRTSHASLPCPRAKSLGRTSVWLGKGISTQLPQGMGRAILSGSLIIHSELSRSSCTGAWMPELLALRK